VSATWLWTTSTTLRVTTLPEGPRPGPAAGYRSVSGTYLRSIAPV
jgi:hypothetical protein